MAGKTTNYNLNTIDLTDSPPDITVLNENAEIIDTEMKTLSDGLGMAAQEETLSALSEKVGATNDSGGTASVGSVFAKLNKIISDLVTHMGRWTSTRAEKLDSIGNTADTGGSATAGTVMGKLNKLFNIGSQIVYPSIENTLTLLSNATICNAVPSAATYWTLGVPVKVKSDGLVRIKLNLTYRYSSVSSASTDVGKLKFGVARCGGDITLDNASILDLASGTAITDSSLIPSERDTLTIAYVDTSTHAVEYKKMLKVNKGDVLVFYGYTYTNCDLYTVNNLSIQYAKMEGEI